MKVHGYSHLFIVASTCYFHATIDSKLKLKLFSHHLWASLLAKGIADVNAS